MMGLRGASNDKVLKRAVTHPLVRRLTVREYLPLGGWLATWAMLGLALGHADAVRMFAANTFVQALRNLCALEMVGTLAKRVGLDGVFKPSRRRALKIDLLVLLACLLVTVLLAGFLWWRNMDVAAGMVLLIGVGLPARHPGGVLAIKRDREVPWRLGTAATAVIGTAFVWQLGLGWFEAALVLGLREWGGLLATFLFGRRRPASDEPDTSVLTFDEVAARTEASARRRLTYRMAKSVLGGLLGPFGTVIARTGRGARLDAKISRMIPRHRGGMAVLTTISAGLMLFFLIVAREPATLVFASAAARIGASGASALLWWNYARAFEDEEDDDDD
ncbi:hypothetical protein GCM10022280_10180 [Sphingomonas swuensis]|uniref:Uncharacterized protein n=1 Tax=Sphingomonas swuensis TaxID=977800 RepID=A0ABP7SMM4_9SPHN